MKTINRYMIKEYQHLSLSLTFSFTRPEDAFCWGKGFAEYSNNFKLISLKRFNKIIDYLIHRLYRAYIPANVLWTRPFPFFDQGRVAYYYNLKVTINSITV